MKKQFLCLSALVSLFFSSLGAGETGAPEEGLLPYDGRWLYPHYVTFRPGNGQTSEVNPPRMSWPYLPEIITREARVPEHDFVLQLTRTGDFADPEIEVGTVYNFYNSLPVLDESEWYWRVGYAVGTDREQWSAVRTFGFAADAIRWDRTVIHEAAELLASRPHPRFGPPDGDWGELRGQMEEDPDTSPFWEVLVSQAEVAVESPWWNAFPESDLPGETDYTELEFADMGRGIAAATLVHRFTGEPRYARARDLALAMAEFPKGGMSSPEYHGPRSKWPSQITEYLALCYDWWYPELSDEEREKLLHAIEWRLEATYLEARSWRAGDRVWRSGVGLHTRSHEYENFVGGISAVLLTAGDLDLADRLVPLCLNYLTGVTSTFGPDEAYNEGLAYGMWKSGDMLRSTLYTALLLPELEIHRNPVYGRLGEWMTHLLPLGIDRLSFADYEATPDRFRAAQAVNLRFIAWLTGEGAFAHRVDVLTGTGRPRPTNRPWLELFGSQRFDRPDPRPETDTNRVFPEAGWVMVSSATPSDEEAFQDAAGMIFISRPRGGYSHSYRAENGFVWHAYGQTLSAGGGSTLYGDLHARHSMSQNVVLINGRGQQWHEWDPDGATHEDLIAGGLISPREADPRYPFVGRLIAWKEGDGFVHWVGDATHAYQSVPELLRWHRHVVFLENRWFVLFDDLAVDPGAEPARFSWLYHIVPDVPLEIEADPPSFSYEKNGVRARVAFAGDAGDLEILNQHGRDGFVNPITGADLYPPTVEQIERGNRELTPDQWMTHNLWVTNRQPAHEWTFLSVLSAWPDDAEAPEVAFDGQRAATISADGISRTVTFDPALGGDIEIDLEGIRAHAEATDPGRLPLHGERESIEVNGDAYEVEWLLHEDFADPLWASRWVVEGDSVVVARDGGLSIHRTSPEEPRAATVWLRPELPESAFIRLRARASGLAGSGAANVSFRLNARERDGSPLRFGRRGDYRAYQDSVGYVVTLAGGGWSAGSRLHRDPGFERLSESSPRLFRESGYELVLTFVDGRLRGYLDGRRIHDVRDDDPHRRGRFGLGAFASDLRVDEIEIGRVLPESARE